MFHHPPDRFADADVPHDAYHAARFAIDGEELNIEPVEALPRDPAGRHHPIDRPNPRAARRAIDGTWGSDQIDRFILADGRNARLVVALTMLGWIIVALIGALIAGRL